MEFHVVIPARYESSRLSGKVLIDFKGKSMLQRVYENAVNSGAESVVIATDDARVEAAAKEFGAKVIMTATEHQSGTERISEAVQAMELDPDELVVGVQANELFVSSETIRQVAQDLEEHDNIKVVSLCEEIHDPEILFSPHMVKVVLNRRNYAMYFSRAPIPWELKNFNNKETLKLEDNHYRHIGIYAYRVGFLQDYMDWPASPVEALESLEQLRILWNGGRIHMNIIKNKILPGVHTSEDIERAKLEIR